MDMLNTITIDEKYMQMKCVLGQHATTELINLGQL